MLLEVTELDSEREQYRTSFLLDAERLDRLGRFEAPLLAGYDAAGELLFVLDLRSERDAYAVRARARSDGGDDSPWRATDWLTVPHPLDILELVWWRSLPGLANGRLQLLVDGLPPLELEGLEMDDSPLVALGEARDREGRAVVQEVTEY